MIDGQDWRWVHGLVEKKSGDKVASKRQNHSPSLCLFSLHAKLCQTIFPYMWTLKRYFVRGDEWINLDENCIQLFQLFIDRIYFSSP